MKPARTASQLLEQLDSELAWRLQELASLRRAISGAQGINQSTLLRAAVPLLYAHWEGYVKGTAIRYAAYISALGVTFGDVQPSFAGGKAMGHVKQLHAISKRVLAASELLIALKSIDSEKAILGFDNHISNIGNLNFDMFEQISGFLSIDTTPYVTKKQLIDESLLRQRNDIAHGDYLTIDADRFESLSNEILGLMRQFKTDVQNAATLRSYLRIPPEIL